jgi:hypothetical protein
VTAKSVATTRAVSDQHTGGWGYLAALTPIIFGTTYLLTTEFLPPGRPLLAALMRSLPTGLVLIIGSSIPPRRWMARFFPTLGALRLWALPAAVHCRVPAAGRGSQR